MYVIFLNGSSADISFGFLHSVSHFIHVHTFNYCKYLQIFAKICKYMQILFLRICLRSQNDVGEEVGHSVGQCQKIQIAKNRPRYSRERSRLNFPPRATSGQISQVSFFALPAQEHNFVASKGLSRPRNDTPCAMRLRMDDENGGGDGDDGGAASIV